MGLLTTAQLATFKADIVADATLNALPNNSDAAVTIAAAYNALAAGPYVVWNPAIQPSDVVAQIVMTEYVALTAIKQAGLQLLLTPAIVDGSSVNVRNAFSAIFAAGTTLTNLTALAKRNATRIEKLFATGAGTTASPSTMTVIGPVSFADVMLARSS